MNAVEKVLWLIDTRGVTQADAARAMTVSPSRVSEWRKRLADGERVTLTTAQAFGAARLFGVSLDWLADDSAGVDSAPGTAADSEEEYILKLARDIGIEEAKDRLLHRKRGVEALTGGIPAPGSELDRPPSAAPPKRRNNG